MNKKASTSAMATMATVAAVGTAAYLIAKPKNSKRRNADLKKSASTAVKNAGVIVDAISSMLG